MNKVSDSKLIKQFTKEEKSEYNHKNYKENRDKRLNYQKAYYKKHKKEILEKANKRYRERCGL